MLDNAAELLNQLGGAGRVLRHQPPQSALAGAAGPAAVSWFRHHDLARLAAVTGHVLLLAGDTTAGRQLTEAAAQLADLGPASRRALRPCLLRRTVGERDTESTRPHVRMKRLRALDCRQIVRNLITVYVGSTPESICFQFLPALDADANHIDLGLIQDPCTCVVNYCHLDG
jgi:hypothetical protein